ncbi:helix-turn-helix transcriptional regulator [Streptomyces sp. NPDC050095]|uniref:helix-turn-helix transcriptional regulator n=1 Tax=unclassified Streptomyces TaxID=2593676 RepID=UPI003419EE1D
MDLAERRRVLGYSQDRLAAALGVDRTTVGRWERGETEPQPPLRPRLAEVLELDLASLGALLTPQAVTQEAEGQPPTSVDDDGDEMIRRDFLRVLTVAGALTALPGEVALAAEDAHDWQTMNGHLWQVFQRARSKATVYPVVRDQLAAMIEELRDGSQVLELWSAAGDLFQLAGELAFDGNRYTDAAASYTLAASAAREARSFDLWACALVRHAYVCLYERRYHEAAQILGAAEKVAGRGDPVLSTRHWVAAVQAQAFAGLGDLSSCQRALDKAEEVRDLSPAAANGGWLRYDSSRLAEERGARFAELGRLDLAEQSLEDALRQTGLIKGTSYRRRGAVLVDLTTVGLKRHDLDQALAYGREAVDLARRSGSGYVARKLATLRTELRPVLTDARAAELDADITALTARREGTA